MENWEREFIIDGEVLAGLRNLMTALYNDGHKALSGDDKRDWANWLNQVAIPRIEGAEITSDKEGSE